VISKFFIERPVLANVIAILMMVIGAVALYSLPVAQYPDVVPPTVQVTTRYPGASARTVIDTVALPIEQQVNGVEGMIRQSVDTVRDRARHRHPRRRRHRCGRGRRPQYRERHERP
jgi:HAE1 family hydrophobic/amphiphilic exporter-1